MDLIIGCVTKKFATFSGRARRKEYWLFILASYILYMITLGIDFATNMVSAETGVGLISAIVMLAMLIPYLAVTVRRLHDTNRSAWWLLVLLVPLIGVIAFLVFMCLKGTEGDNRFDADPLVADPIPA